MPKAVLRNGGIQPVEPLPPEWQEGERLQVEKSQEASTPVEEIDRDFAALAALCADSQPEDEERLAQALEQARTQAKALVRRQMGLEG
jgi:hypothetical protein